LGPIFIVAASTAGALVTSPRAAPQVQGVNQFLLPAVYPPPLRLAADARLQAACAARARELREQLEPGDALLVEPPFVIAGTLSEAELRRWHDGVVLPASSALAASYFDQAPDAPVTLILLDDEAAYRRYALRFAGEQALGYYGYYDSQQRTAVANASAGAGTLLHELTHALMQFDFPNAPAWFAEGLASLHEQCRLREDGRALVGLANWRLSELRRITEHGSLQSVASLAGSAGFRGPDEAVNYAHARAVLLYLERQGVLRAYYKRFRDRFDEDPTGLRSLSELVDLSLDSFDRDFRQWLAGWRTERPGVPAR
jgi:hypothetical protein